MSDCRKFTVLASCSGLGFGLSLAIAIFLGNSKSSSVIDTSSIQQITHDWSTQPFVDFQVVHDDLPCPAGTESLIQQWWQGTYGACDCSRNNNMEWQKRQLHENTKCRGEYYWCDTIEPISPIMMEKVDSSRICGTRGGAIFEQAVRPNASNQCPSDYSACSSKTSAENTICYKTSEGIDSCPITSISFVAPASAAASETKTSTTMVFTDDYSIIFDKHSDNLPLTSLNLEHQPCMVNTETSADPDFLYHPLEIPSGCSVDNLTGLQYDPRYQKTGLTVLTGELEEENNIWDAVKFLPGFDQRMALPGFDAQFVLDNRKKAENYLWARPTISWKLECESEASRTEVVDELQHSLIVPKQIQTAQTLAYIMAVAEVVVLFCMMCSTGDNEDIEQGKIVGQICQAAVACFGFVFAVMVCLKSNAAQPLLDSNKLIIENYASVNGCADEYTNVRTEELFGQIDDDIASLALASNLSFLAVAVYVSSIGIVIFQKYNENKDSEGDYKQVEELHDD